MFAQRLLVLAGAIAAFAATPGMAADGVTATTVTVGQSAAFSGPAAELGSDMRSGIQAFFDQVNRGGGVNGRKLVLKSLDDGYEPGRAAENTRKLIREDIFALIGYVGTPTSEAAKPIFTEARVPFVGAFKTKFGNFPSYAGYTAYDEVYYIAEAIARRVVT